MQNLQILAVEDESVHQANIKSLSRALKFRLTDIVSEVPQAFESFKMRTPDLVLMDLNLHSKHDGLELAREMKKHKEVPIIFTTSRNDNEGIDLIKNAGEGVCLQKPLEEQLLRVTIEQSIRDLRQRYISQDAPAAWPASKPHSFFVRIGNKLKRIETTKIEYIEVEEKYCSIVIGDRQIHVKIALKDFLTKLPSEQFIRVHRNFVVNSNYIQSIQLGEGQIVLESREVPFSRSYKEDLIQRLNLL